MIEITDKTKCCGCSACLSVCPKSCISFQLDDEGFWYPIVDKNNCIGCKLCESVCPCLNQGLERKPKKVYSSKYNNENVRLKSSSGGLFTALANREIEQGGKVYGAAFDDEWHVIHESVSDQESLTRLRGSKYVQSRVEGVFSEIRKDLSQGQFILFSGTPCQVAGLKRYLRKEYENLITVEVVCHGTPSPTIWKAYLDAVSKGATISEISFRDKSTGWKGYSFSLTTENGTHIKDEHHDNLYFRGYLGNCFLRLSCYHCPAKSGKSQADITLGDYWSIGSSNPDFDDDKGVSAVLLWTDKGLRAFNELCLVDSIEQDAETLMQKNYLLKKSVECPTTRDLFWQDYRNNGVMKALERYGLKKEPFLKKILRKIKHILNKLNL